MSDRRVAAGRLSGRVGVVRVLLAFAAVWVLALVGSGLARASSIVYLDHNHNIWITSPDGTNKHQITTNGSTQRYASPTETDKGVIVAPATRAMFYYFKQDGSSAGGPWWAMDMNCPSYGEHAISNQVAPNGAMNVYYFLTSCIGGSIDPKVAFANYNGLTASHIYPTYTGLWYPRWVPGTRYAAAVSLHGSAIYVLNTPGGTPWIADTSGQDRLRYFDISRTGNKVLIATASTPEVNSPSDLILWRNNGTPPAGGTAVCGVLNWGDNGQTPDISLPRWSPDGTQFTWSNKNGVYVSPAPVLGSGENCVIHPKLIAPGGSFPDWGRPDVAPTAAQIKASLAKVLAPAGKAAKIGALLKSGRYKFTYTALTGGRLAISWYKGGKPSGVLVASGQVTFTRAGAKTISVALTAKGRRLLKRAQRLMVTAKAIFTPSGKSPIAATRTFTLKR